MSTAPAIFIFSEYVLAGALISYEPSVTDLYGRAGGYVGRLLSGTEPADLPVQLPTKFNSAINLKTAKALGLDQQLADEVIE